MNVPERMPLPLMSRSNGGGGVVESSWGSEDYAPESDDTTVVLSSWPAARPTPHSATVRGGMVSQIMADYADS